METKSFPASKLNALFCWIFSSCVWSSLLPSVGKRKKIRRCLVTFHTLTLHLVLSPEYYFTEWIGWALFNQLHHPPSSKLTSLSKGCKSEVQKRRQKVGLVAGERCERRVLVFRSTECQKLLRSASHMKWGKQSMGIWRFFPTCLLFAYFASSDAIWSVSLLKLSAFEFHNLHSTNCTDTVIFLLNNFRLKMAKSSWKQVYKNPVFAVLGESPLRKRTDLENSFDLHKYS